MRFSHFPHPQDSSTSSTGLSTFCRRFQAKVPGFPPKCGEFIHILHKLSTGRRKVVDGSRIRLIYYNFITDLGLIRPPQRQMSQFLLVFFVTSFIYLPVIRVFILYTQLTSPVDKKIAVAKSVANAKVSRAVYSSISRTDGCALSVSGAGSPVIRR